MNHTAKIDPAPSDAMNDDVMSETEDLGATGVLEYRPNPNYVADSEPSMTNFPSFWAKTSPLP